MEKIGYGRHEFLNRHIRKNEVAKILEIGVDDGRNAKNMVEAAIENLPPEKIEYYGFDKFKDESKYERAEERLGDTGCNFELYKGNSRETLPKALKDLPEMGLIFIDGGHDYRVVKSDWENSKRVMNDETAIFFHNSDRSEVKRVIDEISRKEFTVDIFEPEEDCPTALVQKI